MGRGIGTVAAKLPNKLRCGSIGICCFRNRARYTGTVAAKVQTKPRCGSIGIMLCFRNVFMDKGYTK